MSESPVRKARPMRADNPQAGAVHLSTTSARVDSPYLLVPTFPSPALPPTAVLSQSLKGVSIATPNTDNVPSLSTTPAMPAPTRTTVIQPLPQSYSSDNNPSSSQPTPPSHSPRAALTKTTQTPGNVTTPSSASPKTLVLSTILSPSTAVTDTQHNSSASPSTTVSASTTSTAAIVSASTNTAREGETSTFTKSSDPIVQGSTHIPPTQTCTSAQHINNTSRSVDPSNILQMRRDRANRPLPPAPNLDWIVPQVQVSHRFLVLRSKPLT